MYFFFRSELFPGKLYYKKNIGTAFPPLEITSSFLCQCRRLLFPEIIPMEKEDESMNIPEGFAFYLSAGSIGMPALFAEENCFRPVWIGLEMKIDCSEIVFLTNYPYHSCLQ